MMINLQKFCQTILLVVLFLSHFFCFFPLDPQTRLGIDLMGDGRVGRKDTKRILNQSVLAE